MDLGVAGQNLADAGPGNVLTIIGDEFEADGRFVVWICRTGRALADHRCGFGEDEIGDAGVVHFQ